MSKLDFDLFEVDYKTIILDRYYLKILNNRNGCPKLISQIIYDYCDSNSDVNCKNCENKFLIYDELSCDKCKKQLCQNCPSYKIVDKYYCNDCVDKPECIFCCRYYSVITCNCNEECKIKFCKMCNIDISNPCNKCKKCLLKCHSFKTESNEIVTKYSCFSCSESLLECYICKNKNFTKYCDICKHNVCFQCSSVFINKISINNHNRYTNLISSIDDVSNTQECINCFNKNISSKFNNNEHEELLIKMVKS